MAKRKHAAVKHRPSKARHRFQPNVEVLEDRRVLDSSVVFSELMYHPAGDDGVEWIELYNQNRVDTELSNWELSGGVSFDFPQGTILSGHDYLVVASDPAAMNALGVTNALGPFSGSLSNSGEQLELVNHTGRLMSSVDYGDDREWPVGPDGSGFTLAKHGLYSATEMAASWATSNTVGGTPGAANGAAPGISLVLNEVSSALAETFWIELVNRGDRQIAMGGTTIRLESGTTQDFVFPSLTLQPGGYLHLTENDLGFSALSGDTLFVLSSDQTQLYDAHHVTNRLRGRSEAHGGDWLYPDAATPGAANSFDFNAEIVINEIMYNALPTEEILGTPAVTEVTEILDYDSVWRYNQTGSQPIGWEDAAHAVDNVEWFAGPGLLARETSALPRPIRTDLSLGRITYYFETEFEIPAGQDLSNITLRHIMDDGGIFYLNGQEILRARMPSGPIDNETFASSTVGNAIESVPIPLTTDALVVGTNRLSVEVHQVTTNSSDIVFGVNLQSVTTVEPEVPTVPAQPSAEEWIELFNHGDQPVDLTGWELAGGISYEIPDGKVLGTGEYFVVAKDAGTLQEKYPDIDVVGGFNGTLSNKSDLIRLVDANKNPADEVRYFDSGKWSAAADGGGSSLELRNPLADNSKAGAWAASDETGKSEWAEITYRQRAKNDTGPLIWDEFIFGLLSEGEVLIDDVQVIEDPDGAAVDMIQNGTFESDFPNGRPGKWRVIGNHSGRVVRDPDDDSNKVLLLSASGPTDHQHNHAETTFADNLSIVGGRVYEFKFRARWLSGSNKLNARLYVYRAATTAVLPRPEHTGTPGAQNSAYEDNIGPTYNAFSHSPAIPNAAQAVTVAVDVEDPDGVTAMELFWSQNGGVFSQTSMSNLGHGSFEGTIPGASAATVVQFYVEATDSQGEKSFFPADGPQSRAMFKVQDGQDPNGTLDTFRMVMRSVDHEELFGPTTLMSNEMLGGTVIYNENEVYYDIGIRLKGSPFGRSNPALQRSYNLSFQPDEPFRGVHDSIALDGSGRSGILGNSRDEILVKHLVTAAGGTATFYDDLAYMISPNASQNGTIILQMARFGSQYLDETYGANSDGTMFELELINFSQATVGASAETLKDGYAPGLERFEPGDLGDSKEDYRWHYMIKNRRDLDDYTNVIEMSTSLDSSGDALLQASREYLDLDSWMRTYALYSLTGNWDTWGFGFEHNLFLYRNPESLKFEALPWDMDFSFSRHPNESLYGSGTNISRLISLQPNRRLFYGHIQDIMETTVNSDYFTPWFNHYSSLTGENYSQHRSYLDARINFVNNQLAIGAPQVGFEIDTNDGNDFSVSEATVTLEGTGWIDVREIRLAGSEEPLDATWLDLDTWRVSIPLAFGTNFIELEAFDFQGRPVGTDQINVTSTIQDRPLEQFLRITEINYNPRDPDDGTNNEDFEFIEFLNTSTSQSLDVSGVEFTDGIDFRFADGTALGPSEYIVVVRNLDRFGQRYNTAGLNIAGEFESGGLSNGGENLEVVDSVGTVLFGFEYDDQGNWPNRADGNGSTLEVIDLSGSYADGSNWSSSIDFHGSPGRSGMDPDTRIVINEVLANSEPPLQDFIELFNTSGETVDISGWYLSDSAGDFAKFAVPAGSILDSNQYLSFDESSFGAEPNGFHVSSFGDDVWLVATDGAGAPTHFADHIEFGPTLRDVSIGRVPNGITTSSDVSLLGEISAGGENLSHRSSDLVITEVHYDPTGEDIGLEFVEIFNATGTPIDLASYRLRGDVDMDFPAIQLSAGAAVALVDFDTTDNVAADAFRDAYNLGFLAAFVGPWGVNDTLDNVSGSVVLQLRNPELEPGTSQFTHVEVDRVNYGSSDPWPSEPAGGGSSLTRVSPFAFGNQASSWNAATPTPGAHFAALTGDFDGDLVLDGDDANELTMAIANQSADVVYDLTNDGRVDVADLDFWITDLFGTVMADANLDRRVDVSDFNIWNDNKFTLDTAWTTADFNADGGTDAADFNIWLDHRFTQASAAAAELPHTVRTPSAPAVDVVLLDQAQDHGAGGKIVVKPQSLSPSRTGHEQLRQLDRAFANLDANNIQSRRQVGQPVDTGHEIGGKLQRVSSLVVESGKVRHGWEFVILPHAKALLED